MDIKEIRKIIELIKENDLSEFELEEEGFRILIKRSNGFEQKIIAQVPLSSDPAVIPGPAGADPGAGEPSGTPADNGNPEDHLEPITSPMVGTFYSAPAPEADAFIAVGAEVDVDTVVCIVEAMKVMNEITAEVKGTIRQILVENAAPVQFGQPLFLIDPA